MSGTEAEIVIAVVCFRPSRSGWMKNCDLLPVNVYEHGFDRSTLPQLRRELSAAKVTHVVMSFGDTLNPKHLSTLVANMRSEGADLTYSPMRQAADNFFGQTNGAQQATKHSSPVETPCFARFWSFRNAILEVGLFNKLLNHFQLIVASDPLCFPALRFVQHRARHIIALDAPLGEADAPIFFDTLDPDALIAQMGTICRLFPKEKDRLELGLYFSFCFSISYAQSLVEMLHSKAPSNTRLFKKYLQILDSLPCFYETTEARGQDAPALLTEGRLDLLRMFAENGSQKLVASLLSGDWPGVAELEALANQSEQNEKRITRYLSFTRGRASVPSHVSAPPRVGLADFKVFLHAGSMKTGSSALQNYLEHNRFRLIKQGFHYPVHGAIRETGLRRDRTPGHARMMAAALRNPEKAAAHFSKISAEAKSVGAETIILSSENILTPRFWVNGRGIGQICAALRASDLTIVWLDRRLDDLLLSSYLDRIANPVNGYVARFEEYVQEYVQSGLLDRKQVLSTLDKASNGRICHDPYEKIRTSLGTELWFCKAVGLNSSAFDPIPEVKKNRSLDPYHAELIRQTKLIPNLDKPTLERLFLRILDVSKNPGFLSQAQISDPLERFRSQYSHEIAEHDHKFGAIRKMVSPLERPTEIFNGDQFEQDIASIQSWAH